MVKYAIWVIPFRLQRLCNMNGASFLHAHTWLVSGKLNVTVTMVSRKIKVKL